jgi:hypothetical protein
MRVTEWIRSHPEALRRVGEHAREKARRTGTSITYRELAEGLVRDWPAEGRRERIELGPGNEVRVIERLESDLK